MHNAQGDACTHLANFCNLQVGRLEHENDALGCQCRLFLLDLLGWGLESAHHSDEKYRLVVFEARKRG